MSQINDEQKFKELATDIRDKLVNVKNLNDIHIIYSDLHTMNILTSLKLKNIHGGKFFEDYYFNLYGVVNKRLNKMINEMFI